MNSQVKLNVQLNTNSTSKNMNASAQNFRSNSQQPFQQQQGQNQIQQTPLIAQKGENNINQKNIVNNSGNKNMFYSVSNAKQYVSTSTKELDVNGHDEGKKQNNNGNSMTLQHVLGLKVPEKKKQTIQIQKQNEVSSGDNNKSKISSSMKLINISPVNINKPRSINLNLGTNFSHRNLMEGNNQQSENQSTQQHQQYSLQSSFGFQHKDGHIQFHPTQQSHQNNQQLQLSHLQNQNDNNGISNSKQQIIFQHQKGIISPIKQFFKNQNNLDSNLNTQIQYNKAFQIQPQTTVNQNNSQNIFSQQTSQVQSAKNKDLKGPFFFPSSKKQQQQGSSQNNLSNSNINLIRKGSIQQDQSNFQQILQQQLQHQVYVNPNSSNMIQNNQSSINQIGSNTNLDFNLLKLEREQLKEKIEKLEQERLEIFEIMKKQTQVKELALNQLKKILEQNQFINKTENQTYSNILQLEQQYASEYVSIINQIRNTLTPESQSFLPKCSPKGKAMSEIRKINCEKSVDDNQQKQNVINFLQRSSLPPSPKRRIHLDKIKDKVLQIGQFDNLSPNINTHDPTKINSSLNNHHNKSDFSSNNLTQYVTSQLANQPSNSTSNTIIVNQKQNSEDNIKSSSHIIGQHVNQELDNNKINRELQQIKERVLQVLKMKSQCLNCQKKGIKANQQTNIGSEDQHIQSYKSIENNIKQALLQNNEYQEPNKKLINQEMTLELIKSFL